MSEQMPSVGRVVHYVSHGSQVYTSECRAAVVTETYGGASTVGLCVLNPSGQFFQRSVTQDEDGHRGGSWHWPERA